MLSKIEPSNIQSMAYMDSQGSRDRARLFAVGEAARLAGTSTINARRWLEGYSYKRKGEVRRSDRKLGADVQREHRDLYCSFLDVLELRTAAALRTAGIRWNEIRDAAALMRQSWNAEYPFAVENLKTDGTAVFALLVERIRSGSSVSKEGPSKKLLQISRNQFAFEAIIGPALLDVVDFDSQHHPTRLWPLGRAERVFVDPSIRFGQPVVADGGVPVEVLVQAYTANDNDAAQVAKMYEVTTQTVHAAVDFGRRFWKKAA